MISVITCSVRPELLPIIEKCLSRQTYSDMEWIVVSPKEVTANAMVLKDPPKRDGDFWSLCKAWNKGYAHAKGDLIVNIQDGIWFEPDLLERYWSHYVKNPKAIVSAVGHQYDQLDSRGRPINLAWEDPRIKGTGLVKVGVEEMEMAVCSVPRQAILDCGGVDEEYDKGPGVQEKEMCLRCRVLGYETYIDQSLEYRAMRHPRLTSDWDDMYWKVTAPMFKRHVEELGKGERPLNVNCLMKYN